MVAMVHPVSLLVLGFDIFFEFGFNIATPRRRFLTGCERTRARPRVFAKCDRQSSIYPDFARENSVNRDVGVTCLAIGAQSMQYSYSSFVLNVCFLPLKKRYLVCFTVHTTCR